jgi:HSP20 family protein
MTLMRRPPSRNTVPLRAVLERLAGDWPAAAIEGGMADVLPPLDVRETDDAYVVEVDLPGIDPDQTEVLVEGRTVTVRGRVEEESEQERGNYLVRERRQGSFLRAVALPGMIDVDHVTTRYQDGQLMITLPKSSASRARRIAIGNGSGKSAAKSGDAQRRAGSRASNGRNSDKGSNAGSGASLAADATGSATGATPANAPTSAKGG